MSFTIFQREKTTFQAIKTNSSKSRKIDIFPKGLTHRFGRKIAIFPIFFFNAIQSRKMSFTIFQSEKTILYAIKTRSSKTTKIDIFLKGLAHGFCPQMAIFPTFFFLGNIGQENDFYDILERKNDIFPKGLTHGFGLKMAIFQTFFFRQYRPGKCVLRYSGAKKRLPRL